MSSLHDLLPKERIIEGIDLQDRYCHIWKMEEGLSARALLLPESTAELVAICKYCNTHRLHITIHGGRTNLTGATASKPDDIVISLEKMNSIEEIDSMNRTMTVQAGAILADVHQAAKAKELLFPLNFGAKGSAQIGGCIANNAGGLRVLKYGMTRRLIKGLEVVLADGTVLRNLKKITKDNSGYDLKQLFIGSEGTLGIITRAVLSLRELPKSRSSAFVALRSFEDVCAFLSFCDRNLGDRLSGFELLWGDTYRALTSAPSMLSPPLTHGSAYYVLIESLGTDIEKDGQSMQAMLEQAMEQNILEDGVYADSEADLNWFWNIREDVGILDNSFPHAQHFDISLPIHHIGNYVENIRKVLYDQLHIDTCYTFGHLADGNIHFIIGKYDNSPSLKKSIDEIVYRPLKALNGSVSAEHGIGVDKKAWLSISKSKEEIELMKSLKSLFDPKGILNPGRIFDL